MSSTYSNLKFELIATGEQSGAWGATTNTNIGTAIEQAIVGMATLETGDFTTNVATLTLSNTNALQDARALCLNITATLSAAGTVNVPAIEKPYIIINNSSGGYAVTVKVSGQTGVSIPNGKTAWVYNNGTDVVSGSNYLPGSTYAATDSANLFTAKNTFSGSTTALAELLTNASEVTTVSATAATGTIAYYVTTQSVLYYTSNASANWTINLTGASTPVTLDTLLSTGQCITVVHMVTQGSTAYYNSSVQVDGTTSGVTTKWLNGAPTAGNVSGIDVYTYTVIKTASATFTVLASQAAFV